MNSLFGGKGGRVPPPTRKLVIRKANSQRDLRPISERVSVFNHAHMYNLRSRLFALSSIFFSSLFVLVIFG